MWLVAIIPAHGKGQRKSIEEYEVLHVATTAIPLPYISVSEQHVVYLKFIQRYMLKYSQVKKKQTQFDWLFLEGLCVCDSSLAY